LWYPNKRYNDIEERDVIEAYEVAIKKEIEIEFSIYLFKILSIGIFFVYSL
jgi:hypothetical protein